jgi:hypothetical protein
VLTSAIAACAIEIFPPVNPSIARLTKSKTINQPRRGP